MMIVQQSLYINSLFTLNSNTDKRHINTKEEVRVETLLTLDRRRISNSQVLREGCGREGQGLPHSPLEAGTALNGEACLHPSKGTSS